MASVEDLIPHRPPWRLLDRVVEVGGGRVRAQKQVSAGDPLTASGELPELLVVEALAQAAACVRAEAEGAHLGWLVSLSGFEFSGSVRTGDVLELHASVEATLGRLHQFLGEARVGERVIARGRMTFALEPSRS